MPSPGVSLTPLAARLELLLRRAITAEQFEADMVSCCEAHPDEVWNLLALLDQYHRLERLPTELYRALKAAIDRYGLVRREPYIPHVPTKAKGPPAPEPEMIAESVAVTPPEPPSAAPSPAPQIPTWTQAQPAVPVAPTAQALSPAVQTAPPVAQAPPPLSQAPPPAVETPAAHVQRPAVQSPPPAVQAPPRATAVLRPATVDEPRLPASALTKVPELAADATPFRHLLDDEPATSRQPSMGDMPSMRQVDRSVRTTRPPRRSLWRSLLLVASLIAAAFAAASLLKKGQTSGDMLSGPDDSRVAAASPAPAIAPVPAPSVLQAPATTTTPMPKTATAATTAPSNSTAATPPAAAAPSGKSAAAPVPTPQPAAAATPEQSRTPTTTAAAVRSPGPSSVELSADNYTVRPGDSAARILVRRSGDTSRDLDFVWWTENATAVADVDYVAWGHRTEKIPAGRNSVTLLVPIINDSTRTATRRFQVVIGPADGGARLGATTHATVQLSGSS